MTITEFLLARIAEDEAGARAATQGDWRWDEPSTEKWPTGDENLCAYRQPEGAVYVLRSWGYDADGIDAADADRAHIVAWQPARVLAECEAKRRIVELAEGMQEEAAEWGDRAQHTDATAILQRLASVYADHPDYREEWATVIG